MAVKKKIGEIVNENYINGAVLYYFGITFYDYSDRSLEEACQERGLDAHVVVDHLESVNKPNGLSNAALRKYPLELIVEYLKHTHHIFVKQRLPYLATLIDDLPGYHPLEKDLQFVFPLFVEDFIHHIYEEEDTLFSYISTMRKYTHGKLNQSAMYMAMESHALQTFAMEHQEHDDDMHGIRQLTNDYSVPAEASLHLRVVFAELKRLEQELQTHASVENDILFPKALSLEHAVRQMIGQTITLN